MKGDIGIETITVCADADLHLPKPRLAELPSIAGRTRAAYDGDPERDGR